MGRFVRLTVVATALMLAFGIAGGPAEGDPSALPSDGLATAPNRVEYVSSLEKICRPGSNETVKAMGNARKDLKDGRVAIAAHKFERASKIYRHTLKAMSAVPRPAADTQRLKAWFGYLNRQQGYLTAIIANLKAGRTIKAQHLIADFIHTGNLANNEVLAFGFNYCSFKPTRYGF
jgi:hypothetical protein